MFDKFKKQIEVDKSGNIPVTTTSELDLLKKQVADQEQIIRELVTTVTWIANHKRFEHIQEKLIVIHNLLDKMMEKK